MKTFGVLHSGVFWLVVNLLHCILPGASWRCQVQYPDTCTLNIVRIGNDKWIDRLATSIVNYTSKATVIKRCLLLNSVAVQEMLEAASHLFDQITLQQYHERILAITNIMTSELIALHSAPLLSYLAIVPNHYLESIHIVNSKMRDIPETITNLINLRFLGIDKSYIRTLDIGLLCALRNLTILQLSKNQISVLHPARESTCHITVQDLFLDHNHLKALDMTVLAPFVALKRLFLHSNNMKSLHCSNATIFPHLRLLVLGPGNNLSRLEFELLHLPFLQSLDLKGNQIKKLPFLNHNNIIDLEHIYLHGNQLSTADLAKFRWHNKLDGFHLSKNQLHSVTCSQYVHLPLLETMDLSTNRLESLSLENCSFPKLSNIWLRSNQFQYLPVELYISGVSPVCVLYIQDNPIQCSSMQKHMELITTHYYKRKLWVTIVGNCSEVNFTEHIRISDIESICCVR